jgi:hypothetical protein
MRFFRSAWLNIVVLLMTATACFATVPTITGFVTQADGNTVTAAIWNSQIGSIYSYINSNLVNEFNKLSTKGDLLTYDGSNIATLSTGGAANNGKILMVDDNEAKGVAWAAIAYTEALTDKGDLLSFDGSNLSRIPVGSDGQVLVARASADSGIQWESNALPAGIIAMWSGTLATIPSGWQLCDGTNGTPNLQGLFIVGAGNVSPAATGGMGLLNPGGPSGDTSAGSGLGPSHNHTVSSTLTSAQSGGGATAVASLSTVSTKTITPRYYALAYIQKL